MAKGKSSRGSAHGTPSSLTSLLALKQPKAIPLVTPTTLQYLQQDIIQEAQYVRNTADRRRHHPGILPKPPGATPRAAGRLVAYSSPAQALGDVPRRVAFALPTQVAICVRRKVRREVLHAIRVAGRTGRGGKRHRNAYSNIKC